MRIWYARYGVVTPFWSSVRMKLTPKVEDLESSGTPEPLELDNRGQNTSHWGVLYTVGKVLKFKCPKWSRMSHLDICNPSYGQKKGRESNWQFDFRPLKVGNRPLPDVYRWSVMGHWKALEESYNFGLDVTPIEGWSQELWVSKVLGAQLGTIFGTPSWESWENVPFGCSSRGEL